MCRILGYDVSQLSLNRSRKSNLTIEQKYVVEDFAREHLSPMCSSENIADALSYSRAGHSGSRIFVLSHSPSGGDV